MYLAIHARNVSAMEMLVSASPAILNGKKQT